MTHWHILTTDADLPLMSRVLSVNEITARVMANRGIRSKKTALAYLSPVLSTLGDPFLMKDAEKAIRHIAEAAANREKIVVYGDYDVDGVMGTVILYKTLKRYGADVDFYIPHRAEEGYGLNKDAVRRMKDAGTELIITIDNGISALAEVDEANKLGMRTVIIDHHEPGFVETDGVRADVVPEAVAVVDVKQANCPYPFKHLCAAGLAYKLAGAFCAYTGMPFTDHDELLALAAIATVCDIVELIAENRVIVKTGLAALNRNKRINPGLGSLIECRGYMEKPIDVFTAGFILGPCINATGRLTSAALSVRLMLADEADAAGREALAQELAAFNEERKAITAESTQRIFDSLAKAEMLDKVLVLVDYETHESVAGIVAGRVKDAFHRPVILLTRGDAAMKGSGRSVDGFNLFEALYSHRHLFIRFGGHAMAAGLTLEEAGIGELRARLNADCTLTEDDFHATLTVDHVLAADEVTLALSEELNALAPFGRGNREPLFATYGLQVETLRVINEKNTLIFTFLSESGRRLKGICFGLNDKFAQLVNAAYGETSRGMVLAGAVRGIKLRMDIVYGIETNVYNGVASAQMRIKDFVLNNK